MVNPATERSRKHRERKRVEAEKSKRKVDDPAADLYRVPFSEFAEQDAQIGDCHMYMALAGMDFPGFDDERDPEEFVIDRPAFGEEPLFGEAKGALGRAEVMIGVLQDTALTLAEAVNRYKRTMIKARIAELEQSKDVDRAKAIKEAVRLNKFLNQLDKQVRRPVPQWRVKGI